jgi:hypothetical protein
MVLRREKAVLESRKGGRGGGAGGSGGSAYSQYHGEYYFDWVVRTRWDLGFVTPPPPLRSLRTGAVHVPYNYW